MTKVGPRKLPWITSFIAWNQCEATAVRTIFVSIKESILNPFKDASSYANFIQFID